MGRLFHLRDIFELFNGIQVDALEAMDVTDEEKKKYKRQIMTKIRERKRLNWKNIAITTAITFGVFTTGLTALSFTTWTEEIPIVY